MADQRRAGIITVKVDGEIQDAKGAFTCGYGRPKRTAIVGSDRVHGFTEAPQVPYIEGAITDRGSLDVAALFAGTGKTVTVDFANGKTAVLRDAWFAGDGTVNTEQAEIPVRWEGIDLEEIS